jgi:hypothetical protein
MTTTENLFEEEKPFKIKVDASEYGRKYINNKKQIEKKNSQVHYI